MFWYLHKRGKETRLAREAEGKQSSSDIEASDMEDSTVLEKDEEAAEHGDDGKIKLQEKQDGDGEKSKEGQQEEKEEEGGAGATVDDLPSVSNLPEPSAAAGLEKVAVEELKR